MVLNRCIFKGGALLFCARTGILSLGDTLALEIAAAEADRPPQ